GGWARAGCRADMGGSSVGLECAVDRDHPGRARSKRRGSNRSALDSFVGKGRQRASFGHRGANVERERGGGVPAGGGVVARGANRLRGRENWGHGGGGGRRQLNGLVEPSAEWGGFSPGLSRRSPGP